MLGSKFTLFLELTGGSLIVDCRCEVSLHSYSPSNVELGLQNANFWGVCYFPVGERHTNFWGCIIKLTTDQILCDTMTGIRLVTSEITF